MSTGIQNINYDMAKNLTYKQTQALAKNPKKRLERIAEVAKENEGLTPYIYHSPIKCGTCKATDGASHPETSYCFYCDTDNWVEKYPNI